MQCMVFLVMYNDILAEDCGVIMIPASTSLVQLAITHYYKSSSQLEAVFDSRKSVSRD